jgi:hypothetical protein
MDTILSVCVTAPSGISERVEIVTNSHWDNALLQAAINNALNQHLAVSIQLIGQARAQGPITDRLACDIVPDGATAKDRKEGEE